MAASGGIQFGTSGSTGPNLFQLGGNKTTTSTFPSFGTAALTSTGGLTFGSKSSTTTGATPLFSLSGGSGTNTLFGTSTVATLSLAKPATTAAAFSAFGLGTSIASTTVQPSFGFGSTTNNVTLASSISATTSAATTIQKQPDNPKDAEIPAELQATVQALEKHVKDQKAKKDEISRFSCKTITKVQEEIGTLKQSLAIISNGIQRDGIGIEMLKIQAANDLKNAEIAQNVREMAPGLQHDYLAPSEYFQRLIQSFEERINRYKQELDDLENYLSSSTPAQDFTPQALLNVLKKLSDTFLSLAAQMQIIHEEVKALKNKYLQCRKVILGDSTNLFTQRKKGLDGNGRIVSVGPSPFTALAGPTAIAMATALNANLNDPRSNQLGTVFGTSQTQQPSLLKTNVNTTGLNRSLSLGGLGGQKTGFAQPSTGLGSSLSGQSAFGTGQTGIKPVTGLQRTFGTWAAPALNTVTPLQQPTRFQLQSPPSGTKRGKLK